MKQGAAEKGVEWTCTEAGGTGRDRRKRGCKTRMTMSLKWPRRTNRKEDEERNNQHPEDNNGEIDDPLTLHNNNDNGNEDDRGQPAALARARCVQK